MQRNNFFLQNRGVVHSHPLPQTPPTSHGARAVVTNSSTPLAQPHGLRAVVTTTSPALAFWQQLLSQPVAPPHGGINQHPVRQHNNHGHRC